MLFVTCVIHTAEAINKLRTDQGATYRQMVEPSTKHNKHLHQAATSRPSEN